MSKGRGVGACGMKILTCGGDDTVVLDDPAINTFLSTTEWAELRRVYSHHVVHIELLLLLFEVGGHSGRQGAREGSRVLGGSGPHARCSAFICAEERWMHMEQRLATFEDCSLSTRRKIYPIVDFLSAGNRQNIQVRIMWSARKSNGNPQVTANCMDKKQQHHANDQSR